MKKKEESSQIRVLYKNVNNIMARITTKEKDGIKRTVLDFKDDNETNSNILKVARESLPLEVNDSNKEAIDSILSMLGYEIKKTLIRDRVVYYKDEVTFELDNYSSPEIMSVVAIEGSKERVDIVYQEISKLIYNSVDE